MKKIPIIPLTIIICVALLGGIYYSVEINKQNSIERQRLAEQEIAEKNRFDLEWCLATAEGDRKDFLRLNGPDGHIDGRFTNNPILTQQAGEQKERDEQKCYQLYK